MALEPAHPRDDRPGPGVCVDGFHEAVVVWTFGPPILPRRLCGRHLAQAIERSWSFYLDKRFRGLTE